MSTPVLHLLAGPNGSGKSTFVDRHLAPATHLPFVNADVIAARTWPGDEVAHAYEASRLSADERRRLLGVRASFMTETVFSHESKVDLVRWAVDLGYLVTLHVVLVPVELSLARVADRVARGGHAVPEEKVRARHARLWPLVARAATQSDRAMFYDNTRATSPFRQVAELDHGAPVGLPDWPVWAAPELVGLTERP